MHICAGKDKGLLILAAGLGIVSAAGSALIAVALQKILDVAIEGDTAGFRNLLGVILLYIGILCIFGFAEALCGKVLLRNVTESLRKRIFSGIIKRRPQAFGKGNTADYLSAVINDVKLVEEQYLVPLLLSCQMAVLFLVTLGILCYLSPLVTVILAAFLLLMFLVPAILGKALQNRQEAYSKQLSSFTAAAKDFLSGFEVIRSFSVSSHIQRRFQKENRAAADAKLRADWLLAVNESLAELLSIISTVVVVFVSAYLVLNGSITAGTLLALIQLSGTFSTPVLVILQNYPKIKGIKPVLEKLKTLAEDTSEWEDEGAGSLIGFQSGLELKEVTFSYGQGAEVLRGLNLSVKPGKKYALLGDSGCGKTTAVKLMTGYSKAYGGTISYDGREVRECSRGDFSRLVSVIHQNVYLFDADLYYNICLGETFSEETLQYALEKSGVQKFLGGLKDGIHTGLGENGNRLSGGQRQRVVLARALIRKTPILILDEGTSAVDKKAAYEIEKELLTEPSLTLLTITHHMQEGLSGLYDEILHMDSGKISSYVVG